MIAVLCGGVGAARFLRALRRHRDDSEITAIVNVGDDLVMHGLTICPDIDTITYTLAGLNDDIRGWGLTDESWRVMSELGELGGENWFSLGDRDLATHLYRSQRIAQGATKSEVTLEIATRRGLGLTLIPVSDDPVATMLDTEIGELSFQSYFVQHHHGVATRAIRYSGASAARPTAGAAHALQSAERIIIAPSNPVLSIEPILAIPGIRDILIARRDVVTAISPFVGGSALKGPADRLMNELGYGATNVGVANYYAPFTSTLVIDEVDQDDVPAVEALGVAVRVTTTVMADVTHADQLVRTVLS